MAKTKFSGPIVADSPSVSTVLVGTTDGEDVVVPVLTADAAYTIVFIMVVALDTTAGNIAIKNGSDTVATVAKGTTAGLTTSATTLADATVPQGNAITIESSSAGNARVLIGIVDGA